MSEGGKENEEDGAERVRTNLSVGNSLPKTIRSPLASELYSDFPSTSLTFVLSVYRVLKFERPLDDYGGTMDVRSFLSTTTNQAEDVLSCSQLHYDHDDESSSALDTVLSLVLDKPFWTNGAGDVGGHSVLALLNVLLYPPPHRLGSFTESVWNGSISRACVSAAVCEAILIDSVSERNCFSLLSVALDSGSEVLASVCLKACLSRFLDAVDHDRDGFVALSLDDITFLMQHDGLNLRSNEEDGLAAICIWVEHDLVNRLNDFVTLFATGIRFSEIDYYSLAEMVDACELVGYHHAATELAAHELIQKTMGWSQENALGMGTIARPRRPLQSADVGRSAVYHTRSLLQRLMHVQDEGEIAHGMLGDLLKDVVARGDDEARNGPFQAEDDKENDNNNNNDKNDKGYNNGDDEPNMFSRTSSVDFAMVSPSRFGSAVNLQAMAGGAGGATRSIMDLSNLMRESRND